MTITVCICKEAIIKATVWSQGGIISKDVDFIQTGSIVVDIYLKWKFGYVNPYFVKKKNDKAPVLTSNSVNWKVND